MELASAPQEDEFGRHGLEEDYVLKQAFSALVPAFDPRPGRTNVPQIQDFEILPPGSDNPALTTHAPLSSPKGVKLTLTLKVDNVSHTRTHTHACMHTHMHTHSMEILRCCWKMGPRQSSTTYSS